MPKCIRYIFSKVVFLKYIFENMKKTEITFSPTQYLTHTWHIFEWRQNIFSWPKVYNKYYYSRFNYIIIIITTKNMVPFIITLLQWEFVVTTMVFFFSVHFSLICGKIFFWTIYKILGWCKRSFYFFDTRWRCKNRKNFCKNLIHYDGYPILLHLGHGNPVVFFRLHLGTHCLKIIIFFLNRYAKHREKTIYASEYYYILIFDMRLRKQEILFWQIWNFLIFSVNSLSF